ncbi:MAG: hypothetical protein NTZ90_08205 [Proteobacteria bacterium]|nr:hypothetical protein [Pseudomonadota bacterium]
MYYPSVNRGLSFTKPGIYSFGLVLAVGLVAVSSGINGLYVFLSAGLGGFIVSGMLSELAIRSCSVVAITGALVDADSPFVLTFMVENTSSWFSVFAMRSLFLTERPRFRLISRDPTAVGTTLLTRVPPATRELRPVTIAGLPRGIHRRLLTLQSTTFPFGILDKFKLLDLSTELVVAPRLDEQEIAQQRRLLAKELSHMVAEQDFYAHKAYSGRESRRAIDWKKSANQPILEWVVRDLRTPAGSAVVWLDLPWAVLAAATTATDYEYQFIRARAAMHVLEGANISFGLDFGDGMTSVGKDASMMALAQLPSFPQRHQSLPASLRNQPPPIKARRLQVLA